MEGLSVGRTLGCCVLLVSVALSGGRDLEAADDAEPIMATQLGGDVVTDTPTGPYVSVSLSADGSIAAIGEPPAGRGERGITRIRAWDGDEWTQVGGDIEGEADGDFSGEVSLSADGSRVAIGASQNDGAGADAGHVRVFDWNGGSWTQAGSDIDGGAPGDYSGSVVSLSADGDRVAIGSPLHESGGQVRVYSWDGSAWIQLGADINGENAADASGTSVSLSSDGNRVAIGAPGNDPDGGRKRGQNGQVRVYAWDGTSWIQLGSDIDGDNSFDTSGTSVSLSADGDRVAVGAPQIYGGRRPGYVRLYTWDGTDWVKIGNDIAGQARSERSGTVVSLSAGGDRVAIGVRGTAGFGEAGGEVRIYVWDGSRWAPITNEIEGQGVGEQLGRAVSLSGDGRRVGVAAASAGAASRVRIYALEQAEPTTTPTTPTTPATAVVVTPTVGRPGQLPATGSGWSPLLLAGAVFAAGSSLVLAVRRSRS